MGIDEIREIIDNLYAQGKADMAEEVLINAASVAADEGDDYLLLQVLNELIGHYRETGEWDKAFEITDRSVMVAGALYPEESIPYATTLLNAASMYRAAGKLEESRTLYRKVEKIYAVTLKSDDMLYASLYNNEALLYQEEGKFAEAKALLLKALDIDRANGREYEEAVSLANIAATMIQLNDLEEALKCAESSIALFESQGVADQHLSAAYSAMGSYYFMKGKYEAAASCFKNGYELMEKVLGKNGYYERLVENYRACIEAQKGTQAKKTESPETHRRSESSLDICRKYYEKYVGPMIDEKFPEYASKIAVGLAGEGSDAFGLDDELSRDHDWGPSVVMWITDETDKAIGDKLRAEYEALPEEIEGFKRAPYVQGRSRRGVQVISEFFTRLTGAPTYEEIDWKNTEPPKLAAAVNGQVWRDDEGIVTDFRNRLREGYPSDILFANLAECCARFSREGQYNAPRMLKRGDELTAKIFVCDAIREAMKIRFFAEGMYHPHDKWLRKMVSHFEDGEDFDLLLKKAEAGPEGMEELGAYLAMMLYRYGYISDIDPYLDHQTEELLQKSLWSRMTDDELATLIAKDEFEAFDKVQNEGGRASCQDDWPTFSIMRRSQYLTWNRTMLLQYVYDFEREMRLGHNLITEKYGRMMQYTAPAKYEEIKDNFPVLSEEKLAIIDQIAKIQVAWMEEFAEKYPAMAANARSIHSYQDREYNTSYETYLRGELGTYSDKMLELYAQFIVDHSRNGRNLAFLTMENTAKLYGFDSLDAAERFMAK